MAITTADIKSLREMTGAGILDCKKVLQETDGNIDEAVELLRKKGLAAASKKASREANDGTIVAQVTDDGTVGAMVEVNCETDFVARTEAFQAFANNLLELVVNDASVTSVDTLLSASLNDSTVAEELKETIAKLGENIVISNVIRYQLQGDGVLDSYIHIGGRVGVLVELNGSGDAKVLAHDIALQIAAAAPRYLSTEDVPQEAIDAEKSIYLAQIAEEKKPDNIKERIVEGKLKKWMGEITLLNQAFVKDTDLTIGKLIQKFNKESGTDVSVNRFARFELGVE